MKYKVVILMISLFLSYGGVSSSFASDKKEGQSTSYLLDTSKKKKKFSKRKKRYKNSTVIKIKRTGKGPNKARRNFANNFR